VHVLDSQSGRRFGLDENSRYAMASTFKVALAAALLWQVDRKAFTLDHRIHIEKSQLLLNSPAVEVKLMASEDAMTVRDLLAAVIKQSDNAATNVLLRGWAARRR
jgi:beta-lactamase class A